MSEALRVVSIGGGNGLSALLTGLKRYAHPANEPGNEREAWLDITAVVTVTDDGGSSGRLRRELDVLPPGDIRNCMVALAEDEAFLSRLFQYRFEAGSGLKGHSFGNLFLTAMTRITGDFADAIRQSAEVLKIAGRIFPSTTSNVSLSAVLDNGRVVRGETNIGRSSRRIREVRLEPRGAKPLPETLAAIAEADLITIGPGSLYTSLIPNLLVTGIPKAIRDSKALKVCFVNLMSQPGETTDFTAEDHLAALLSHAGAGVIECAVVNTSHISPAARKIYAAEAAAQVKYQREAIRGMGIEVVEAELLERFVPARGKPGKVRHDAAAIAAVAMTLAQRGRARRDRMASADSVRLTKKVRKNRMRQTGR